MSTHFQLNSLVVGQQQSPTTTPEAIRQLEKEYEDNE